MKNLIESIRENPVIAAIRREEDIEEAIRSEVSTIFILNADIFNIQGMVDRIRSAGKNAFIHVDFLEGLGRDNKSIDYITQVVGPDGIISTKSSHIKYAKDKGLFTIQRFFLIDSLSYETSVKTAHAIQPDMIEMMPAVMPGVIRNLCRSLSLPVIAGGLIDSKDDIIEILKAGAVAASTGKKELWNL